MATIIKFPKKVSEKKLPNVDDVVYRQLDNAMIALVTELDKEGVNVADADVYNGLSIVGSLMEAILKKNAGLKSQDTGLIETLKYYFNVDQNIEIEGDVS